ncbi:relaxase/mobilization nuclease domain-containing protein [Chitinophaga sp. SYP-B3965]|uniref:relaxase/mobilization nuclease domain-containing protein n=1 Tax=Chitinophaga sp. SYP-B3965 TaxID=2663120 RepID=UPI001299BBD7|nr:relaxase/mobilization nuclease domain-containing protein [Chitinophaga sp. SYP-B3965]MRG48292.1 relaxase/mobilization nuclease domain-containing protein [Chitinophaga sp. SYP-B3965]
MVIRGKTRGNGKQLANYLLTQAENENIEILDVDGRADKSAAYLQQALLSMSLTSELSRRSDKGLYHAQINPAYGDDKNMTPEMWQQAADMLGAALKLENQRRVIVLHTKLGRTHAHVVWQRYDLEKRKMISNSFSRLAQNRVRLEMEKAFEHQPTPEKNMRRPEMKEALSKIWQQTKTGTEFIKEARKAGYTIAATTGRRPFMVIDEQGRSFDLVRQLEKVVTKDVRERLKDQKLQTEKDALKSVKAEKAHKKDMLKRKAHVTDFTWNRDKITNDRRPEPDPEPSAWTLSHRQIERPPLSRYQAQHYDLILKMKGAIRRDQERRADLDRQQEQERHRQAAQSFADNRETSIDKGKMTQEEKDRIQEETLRILREMQQNRLRDKGLDFDL